MAAPPGREAVEFELHAGGGGMGGPLFLFVKDDRLSGR